MGSWPHHWCGGEWPSCGRDRDTLGGPAWQRGGPGQPVCGWCRGCEPAVQVMVGHLLNTTYVRITAIFISATSLLMVTALVMWMLEHYRLGK